MYIVVPGLSFRNQPSITHTTMEHHKEGPLHG